MARVWDADSHAAIAPPLRMDSSGRSLDFSPDGALVAVGSEAGTVRIWDLETGQSGVSALAQCRPDGVRPVQRGTAAVC